MQQKEFNQLATELVNAFGAQRWSTTRLVYLWESVQDLSPEWFRRTVKRVVLSMDYNFDWLEAARAERSARGNVQRAQRVIELPEATRELSLEEILSKAGSRTQEIYQKILTGKRTPEKEGQ